jgi:hypothetical protein
VSPTFLRPAAPLRIAFRIISGEKSIFNKLLFFKRCNHCQTEYWVFYQNNIAYTPNARDGHGCLHYLKLKGLKLSIDYSLPKSRFRYELFNMCLQDLEDIQEAQLSGICRKCHCCRVGASILLVLLNVLNAVLFRTYAEEEFAISDGAGVSL